MIAVLDIRKATGADMIQAVRRTGLYGAAWQVEMAEVIDTVLEARGGGSTEDTTDLQYRLNSAIYSRDEARAEVARLEAQAFEYKIRVTALEGSLADLAQQVETLKKTKGLNVGEREELADLRYLRHLIARDA